MGGEKSTIVKLKPQFIPEKNISFGGTLEKEMIETFNTFDILWYAPENSEKLEQWIAFTNVVVQKITNEELFKTTALIIKMIRRSIVIATGNYAEKTIPKIAELLQLDVIIYCMNKDYHKQWSEKYQIIKGVFTTPGEIFEYLLKFQKLGFDIPVFNYKIISSEEFNFNFYDSLKNSEFILKDNIFNLKLNKYERSCSGRLYELKLANANILDFFDFFRSNTVDVINLFYGQTVMSIPGMDYFFAGTIFDRPTKELNLFFIALNLISVYFSKLPYLYGVLNYDEILNLLKEKLTIDELRKDYHELLEKYLNYLFNKLNKENASILEEVIHLKFLQAFLIKFQKFFLKEEFVLIDFCKFPLLIKYFMDIDFCLKLFFCNIFELFKSKQYKINQNNAVNEVDKRLGIFYNYILSNYYKTKALKHISEEELNTINETLKIRDFIVVGNNNFHKMIQKIENNFAHKKIGYIDMLGLREYLIQKKDVKYRNFTYYLIIEAETAEKMYKEIYTLKNDFGLLLFLIIYNKNIKKLINKRPFQIKIHLPLFIANNENEIINVINSQEYINCGLNFLNDTSNIINSFKNIMIKEEIQIPKNEIKADKIIDRMASEGGLELVDKIPEKVFEDSILGTIEFAFITDNIKMQYFEMFKEKKIDFLFNQTYCKYFNFVLLPEFLMSSLNIPIKHFLYAYTLDEGPNSFYYLMNKDLRSGDYSKIKKYIDTIALINSSFKEGVIKSYKGKVFRGTKLENEYIEEKIKVGKVLTNLSFWSASKDRKIAEKFLKGKNIMFIIETKNNNIDIDNEQISKFEEKEVLFIPFSKFLVKSRENIIFNGHKIYQVKLEGLDEQHERKKIKQVPMTNYLLQTLKKNN